MKNQRYFSLLSLAMTGILYGGTQAFASPLLDSDLASFTVLGAAMMSKTPTDAIGGNAGEWSSGGANAIAGGLNASPGVAAVGQEMGEGAGQAGISVAQLARARLTTAIDHPESSTPAAQVPHPDLDKFIHNPGGNDFSAGPANRSAHPARDDRKIAWKDFCSNAQANPGAVTSDQGNISTICADILSGNGGLDVAAASGATTNAVFRPTTLLIDGGSNNGSGELQGAQGGVNSPDNAIATAFLPFALVNDNSGSNLPEPAMLALLAVGFVGLEFSRRRYI